MPERCFRLALVGLALFACPTASADEGLFTFDRPPRGTLEEKYGFEIGDAWLSDVFASMVRFGRGGSGAFVSDRGLVVTNRHVGIDCIQKLSTPVRDLYTDGFIAAAQEDELRCPGLEVESPVGIKDVTAQIAKEAAGAKNAAEAEWARRRAAARIERECSRDTGLRCIVVPHFDGGRFVLHTYRRHTDVRLVFAPEKAAAWLKRQASPAACSYCDFDVAFFRVYEKGVPYRSPRLQWSPTGPAEGELVLVAGFPGYTDRALTKSQLNTELSVMAPFRIRYFSGFKRRLDALSGGPPEVRALIAEDVEGVEEAVWRQRQVSNGRTRAALLRVAAERERDLGGRAGGAQGVKDRVGAAVASVDAVQNEKAAILKRAYATQIAADYVELLSYALTIVRLCVEQGKPDDERYEEYREGAIPSIMSWLGTPVTINKAAEKIRLHAALATAAAVLGPDDPAVAAALGGEKPAVAAQKAVDGTNAGDASWRTEKVKTALALEPGARAAFLEGLKDPMMALALRLDPISRELRRRFIENVESVERGAAVELHDVRAAAGGDLYPDAIYTPRLSFGAVRGCGGVDCRAAYRLGDLFGPPNKPPPAALPPEWRARKNAIDPAVPLSFLSTADFVGGSSGSPVLSRAKKVTGVLYAVKKEAVIFRYAYEEKKGRAVALDAGGVLHVLDKVYGFARLAGELTAVPGPAAPAAGATEKSE